MYPLPPHPRTGRPHIQCEAFCRMLYRDTAGNEEWIWNSRDGVTPFIVTSRQGLEAQHVEWRRDDYRPNHVPAIGERIFVDMTVERARKFAALRYEKAQQTPEWAADIADRYSSRDHFIAEIALAIVEQFGGQGPDLIEVTADVRKRFVPPERPIQAMHVRPRNEPKKMQELKEEIERLQEEARAVPGYDKVDEDEIARRALHRLESKKGMP